MAHITGGGLYDNLPRVLPANTDAFIDSSTWPVLPIFQLIQKTGNIDIAEMFRVFNMGIGLTLIVDKNQADDICRFVRDENAEPYIIGQIRTGTKKIIIE